jgi:hypothetical protein
MGTSVHPATHTPGEQFPWNFDLAIDPPGNLLYSGRREAIPAKSETDRQCFHPANRDTTVLALQRAFMAPDLKVELVPTIRISAGCVNDCGRSVWFTVQSAYIRDFML